MVNKFDKSKGFIALFLLLAMLLAPISSFAAPNDKLFDMFDEVQAYVGEQNEGEEYNLAGAYIMVKPKGAEWTEAKRIDLNDLAVTSDADGVTTLSKDQTVKVDTEDKELTVTLVTPNIIQKGSKYTLNVKLKNDNTQSFNSEKAYTVKEKETPNNDSNQNNPTEDLNAVAKNYLDGVKVLFTNKGVVVKLPGKLEGKEIEVTAKDDKGLLKTATVKTEAVPADLELGITNKEVNVEVTVKVKNVTTNVVSDPHTKVFNLVPNGNPVLNYAYVIDGDLIINVTAPTGVKNIYWRYSDEDTFKALPKDGGFGTQYADNKEDNKDFSNLFGTTKYYKYKRLNENDYRIPVVIPSKVQIVLVDNLENKVPVVLDLNKDNAKVQGNVPSYVDDLYKSLGDTDVAKKLDDLLIVSKDTKVNLFEEFEKGIVKEFKNFNTRELKFDCEDLASFDPFNIKFDKAGRFVFTITAEGKTGEFKFTVLVMEGKNNVKSFKIVKENKVPTDKFKPVEAFEFNTTDGKDANPIGFYAKYDGNYYRLVDEVPFGKTEKAVIEIRDILNNKKYETTFIKGGLEKISLEEARKMFSDIKNHWAEEFIVNMVANGVISGYPDGTFKPNNMISKREVLAIAGRYASTQTGTAEVKPIHKEVKFQKASWGDAEVEYALKRLPVNIFENDTKLDEAASREEVAYILAHNFVFNNAKSTADLTDIDKSKFQDEVKTLIGSGTIIGYPDKTFKPDISIVRAELVTLISRIPGTTAAVRTEMKKEVEAGKTEDKEIKTSDAKELDNLFN